MNSIDIAYCDIFFISDYDIEVVLLILYRMNDPFDYDIQSLLMGEEEEEKEEEEVEEEEVGSEEEEEELFEIRSSSKHIEQGGR